MGPVLGLVEPNKVYVTGLNDKITKDQLELSMERFGQCEVLELFYGLDPTFAMVTYKNKIGRGIAYQSAAFSYHTSQERSKDR